MEPRRTQPALHPLTKAVAEALRSHGRLPATRANAPVRMIVAVSGGADSVALLRALTALAPRRGWHLQLAVGHVQHHLRSDAESDARFVAKLSDELGLPLLRADLDLHAAATRRKRNGTPTNLEARARRERYSALLAMARTWDAKYVVVAHHGDDQVETLLMRALRGTSIRGLRGMAWRRRFNGSARNLVLLRPMLGLSHGQAIEFLQAIGQRWCEDHTNADVTRTRARLRAQVLPVLREMQPGLIAKASALTRHLREVSLLLDQAIDRAADRVLRQDHTWTLDRIDARTLQRVVLAGLLRRLLREAGAQADKLGTRGLLPLVRAVRDGAGGRRSFSFSTGVSVVVTRGTVEIVGVG